MITRILRSEERADWNKLLSVHPDGGVEQSWEWGELQSRIPGRPHFYVIGVFDKEVLVGGALVIRQEMGQGKTWLWCPRGPILPSGQEEVAWRSLLKEIGALAKLSGDVFMRLEPGVPAGESFVAVGRPEKIRYFPEHTLTLDLRPSEADILAQMTQKGRYNIKQAEKQGVVVEELGEKGIDEFYALLTDTASRDTFAVHKATFYRDFLKTLGGKLYLAREKSEVVAGMLVIYFGKTGTYYFGASSSAHRDSKAPYLLQWTAILDAKKAGMETYDFLGIAPEGDAAHALAGVTQFKTRFGGKRVSYHSAQIFVFRPFWWALYRFIKRLKP